MKYFVRASDDAPDKGPYTAAQVRKSHEKGMLGPSASARAESDDAWRPLKDVVAALPPKKRARARSDDDAAHALGAIPPPRRFNPLVWLGVITGVAGIGLTAAFASAGNNAPWPVALIVGGAYVAVRGLIRGAPREDE